MRKKSIRPYLQIIGALLLIMSLPERSAEKLHGTSVAMLSPMLIKLAAMRVSFQEDPDEKLLEPEGDIRFTDQKIHELELENHRLRNEVNQLETLVEEKGRLGKHKKAVAATVIFRSPTSWNSSLWINIGKRNGSDVVVKNSPVLIGTSIIGVIDYVGYRQSRVRLITDSGLSPSVRVKRTIDGKDHLLAKGELHGSREPLWRSQKQVLVGVGFNYDFADEQGPARDLRTGEPLGNHGDFSKLPILLEGDLLVTTGMDGVFPPGLEVAKVTHIETLKEGDYFYRLEAIPTAGNLDDLTLVFVIPPVGFDPTEQPSFGG